MWSNIKKSVGFCPTPFAAGVVVDFLGNFAQAVARLHHVNALPGCSALPRLCGAFLCSAQLFLARSSLGLLLSFGDPFPGGGLGGSRLLPLLVLGHDILLFPCCIEW